MEMLDPNNPKPGVYYDVPFSVYCRVSALNHSTVKHMAESPAKCKMEMESRKRPSDDQLFGSVFHVHCLQRKLWGTEVVVWDKGYGKKSDAWDEFVAACLAKDVLPCHPNDIPIITQMGLAISQHTAMPLGARRLRDKAGRTEVVIVWDDPAGLLCKARLDKVIETPVGWLRPDVKTTKDGRWRRFIYDVEDYGYDTQDSFQRRGIACLNIKDAGEALITVNKSAPHQVEVYQWDEASKAVADVVVNGWIAEFVKCKKENNWPNRNDPHQVVRTLRAIRNPDFAEQDEQQEERKWTPITAS